MKWNKRCITETEKTSLCFPMSSLQNLYNLTIHFANIYIIVISSWGKILMIHFRFFLIFLLLCHGYDFWKFRFLCQIWLWKLRCSRKTYQGHDYNRRSDITLMSLKTLNLFFHQLVCRRYFHNNSQYYLKYICKFYK